MSKSGKLIKALTLVIFFISYVVYLYWRGAYTIPFNFGYASIIMGVLLFAAEIVGFIEAIIFYVTLWDVNTPSTPEMEDKNFPDVDIFIATYNEPVELLRKTIIGCKNMEYPKKNKVHIYVCDDGRRQEIERLCWRLRVSYITRSDNAHAKAGNLNNALSKTTSPYIVTFDADMIPMHDFLMKTIPFFLTEEKIGFVQVPQNFYNPDSFQYNLFLENNIPNEQNLFARVIQAGKSRFNAVIYAGSNTVISRQALDEVGGLVVGTITEDFATGMMIQSKGYKCICLNEVHASGLSPESLEDLYNQRIRWGRGVIQTFKAFNPLFLKGLGLMQRIMYFSAFSYWYFGIWRFIFLAAPIAFSVFGIVVLSASAISILKFWLPMFIFTNVTFRLFAKNVMTSSWSHIYDTIMFPQITKGVIMETLGIKMSKFKVTPKDNIKREDFINRFELVRVQIIFAILTAAGIFRMIYFMVIKTFSSSHLINILWLIYNLYLLIMAILFATERPKLRSSERFQISEKAVIKKGEKVFKGVTKDISETGLSFIIDDPVYLNPYETHEIVIITEKYLAKFLVEIIRVDNVGTKYKYAFRIAKIDEVNYEKLILILYDRVPVQKQSFIGNRIYKNLLNALSNRSKKIVSMKRKLPRVKINKDITAVCEEGLININICDFNFTHFAIKADKKYLNITIPLNKDRQLDCLLDKELTNKSGRGVLIYSISNYGEITEDNDIVDLLKNYTPVERKEVENQEDFELIS